METEFLFIRSGDLPSNTGETFDCDFEVSGACGWSPDPTGSLSWQVVDAGRHVDGLIMLLPKDHSSMLKTLKGKNSSCFLLIQKFVQDRQ